jgi:hypothetical protein
MNTTLGASLDKTSLPVHHGSVLDEGALSAASVWCAPPSYGWRSSGCSSGSMSR